MQISGSADLGTFPIIPCSLCYRAETELSLAGPNLGPGLAELFA